MPIMHHAYYAYHASCLSCIMPIMPIIHHAYHASCLSCLSCIMPIMHHAYHAYYASCLSWIMPIMPVESNWKLRQCKVHFQNNGFEDMVPSGKSKSCGIMFIFISFKWHSSDTPCKDYNVRLTAAPLDLWKGCSRKMKGGGLLIATHLTFICCVYKEKYIEIFTIYECVEK